MPDATKKYILVDSNGERVLPSPFTSRGEADKAKKELSESTGKEVEVRELLME